MPFIVVPSWVYSIVFVCTAAIAGTAEQTSSVVIAIRIIVDPRVCYRYRREVERIGSVEIDAHDADRPPELPSTGVSLVLADLDDRVTWEPSAGES
jgi:hypothetical protein